MDTLRNGVGVFNYYSNYSWGYCSGNLGVSQYLRFIGSLDRAVYWLTLSVRIAMMGIIVELIGYTVFTFYGHDWKSRRDYTFIVVRYGLSISALESIRKVKLS